jgi:hypothetical protein
VSWKVAVGDSFFSGLSRSGRTLRFMILNTLPPQALAGRPAAVLWLVRHGQSTWNVLGLVQGHCDQARLTARGAHQARNVANQLRGCPIGALYASDLQRAVATAAPLASVLGLSMTRDRRLRERSLGALEGTASAAVPSALSGRAARSPARGQVNEGRRIEPGNVDRCVRPGERGRGSWRSR